MKTWLIGALMVGLAGTFVPSDVDAKRLGGGRAAGMQRTAPDKPAQAPQTPAQPAATPNNTPNAPAAAAAPGATGAAAAAAAPKRSWMGPIAGLAAGIGLAALFTHLGWGEGLANFVMLALLAVVAVVAIRWLMRRFAGGGATARERTPFAMAGAGAGAASTQTLRTPLTPPTASTAAPQIAAPVTGAVATAPPSLPADFDTAAFERIAKMIFIRLQAANDKADVNDLRAFTTPELFSSLKLDLHDRGNAAQQTDVVTLNAELLDFAQEDERQIVSVRFHGLIREESHNGAEPFDEVWHLVRPAGGQASAWAIAGIQPRQ
jgi:predicted lipid-binding transport protein (Tim44 family)